MASSPPPKLMIGVDLASADLLFLQLLQAAQHVIAHQLGDPQRSVSIRLLSSILIGAESKDVWIELSRAQRRG
jgi:uncharacterized protein YfiM (DUF2279 family)